MTFYLSKPKGEKKKSYMEYLAISVLKGQLTKEEAEFGLEVRPNITTWDVPNKRVLKFRVIFNKLKKTYGTTN